MSARPKRLYPENIIRRTLAKHVFDGQNCGCGFDLAGFPGKTVFTRWVNHVMGQANERWKKAYEAGVLPQDAFTGEATERS